MSRWVIALIFIAVVLFVLSGRKTAPSEQPFRVTTTAVAPTFVCPIPGTC